MSRKSLIMTVLLASVFACKNIPEEIAVSSVIMNMDRADMIVGESLQLSATISPTNASEKNVIWSSSKQSVASISESGLVTAIAEGSSTITAFAGGKTATCLISVESTSVAVSSIELNPTNAKLTVGETMSLTAVIKPDNATDKSIIWTSSAPEVATVEDGLVKAAGTGSARITASAGDKSAVCEIVVTSNTVPVEAIELNYDKLTLIEGETETIIATVKPDNATDKSIIWTSSAPEVVTVEDGLVKAASTGSARITASAGDKSAVCEIVVTSNTVPVEAIELNYDKLTLIEGETETIIATVKPDNATDQSVTWSTSNPLIATVENGIVKGVNLGEAVITAMTDNKIAFCNVEVIKDPLNESIVFADFKLKEKLVAAFDKNGDGELSYNEVANITSAESLKHSFGDEISFSSFNEFQYFTGITRIPEYMFEKWLLESIVLPPSITSIGKAAFMDCTNLRELIIPEGIKEIPWRCFYNCMSLTSVFLPESVAQINFQAFYHAGIESIIIPKNVTYIGGEAFFSCRSLFEVSLPKGLKTIDYGAFSRCSNLISISLPESLTIINGYVFSECISLETVIFPESIEELKSDVFRDCISLKKISLPNSIKRMGGGVFSGCSQLTSISLPSNLGGEFPYSTFKNCTSLRSIELPQFITSISDNAFSGCYNLEAVIIPNNVVKIASHAFWNCSSLNEITIPEKVREIGSYAFSSCSSLKKINVLPQTVPSGYYYQYETTWGAFNHTNNCPIYVPIESIEAYKTDEYWNDYSDRIQAIPSDN